MKLKRRTAVKRVYDANPEIQTSFAKELFTVAMISATPLVAVLTRGDKIAALTADVVVNGRFWARPGLPLSYTENLDISLPNCFSHFECSPTASNFLPFEDF